MSLLETKMNSLYAFFSLRFFFTIFTFFFSSINICRNLGKRSYFCTYLHTWRTYRVWVLCNKIMRGVRRFNGSCCWKGQSFSSKLLILRTTLSSLFLCWLWHLSDPSMRWLSSKGGKKNECSRKKLESFFSAAWKLGREGPCYSASVQLSHDTSPPRCHAGSGAAWAAGATLHRCNTRVTFEVKGNTYVRAWCRTDPQCYDNTFRILKTVFKSFSPSFCFNGLNWDLEKE